MTVIDILQSVGGDASPLAHKPLTSGRRPSSPPHLFGFVKISQALFVNSVLNDKYRIFIVANNYIRYKQGSDVIILDCLAFLI